ncbi:MAG: metallophosphoesterase [Planctomycetota bacterium]|nr:metallophosphoesterase [Planctomycetota bacterium]
MKVGIFADSHDHVDNVRRAVARFNREGCELVLFAGDFVSPIVVPPLRKLNCPAIACFGDNDANKVALEGGMRIIGPIGEPPFGVQLADGTRILIAHEIGDLQSSPRSDFDVAIFAHTHRASIKRDEQGRLYINPGETSGWTYRKPTVVLLETSPLDAVLLSLPEMPEIDPEA